MKFALLVLVALLGTANASLKDDLQDILALIPVEEIQEISAWYAANDPEFQLFLSYLQSDEFKAITSAIGSTDEFQEFVIYLSEAGIEWDDIVDLFWSLLGVENTRAAAIQNRSFHGWWQEVSALIPTREILILIQVKIRTSPEFREFVELWRSAEFEAIIAAIYHTPEWQALLEKGREHGAPVDLWLELLYAYFGWEKPE